MTRDQERMAIGAGVGLVAAFAVYELFIKKPVSTTTTATTVVPSQGTPAGKAWVSVTGISPGDRVRMSIPTTSALAQSVNAQWMQSSFGGATSTIYPAGTSPPSDWPASDTMGTNAVRVDFTYPTNATAMDLSTLTSQGVQIWALRSVSGA